MFRPRCQLSAFLKVVKPRRHGKWYQHCIGQGCLRSGTWCESRLACLLHHIAPPSCKHLRTALVSVLQLKPAAEICCAAMASDPRAKGAEERCRIARLKQSTDYSKTHRRMLNRPAEQAMFGGSSSVFALRTLIGCHSFGTFRVNGNACLLLCGLQKMPLLWENLSCSMVFSLSCAA